MNIKRIRKYFTPVVLSFACVLSGCSSNVTSDNQNNTVKKEFQYFEIVTSSFRIDSIVAKITNKSRSKIKEFLEQEFVKLNHVIVKNGEKNCSVEDILSIRKYGRFTIKSFEQNKRSLKYRITISKLI